ncbi:MAG: hypothetical protein ABH843_05450 [Candidatus Omnitrophota bacterium]
MRKKVIKPFLAKLKLLDKVILLKGWLALLYNCAKGGIYRPCRYLYSYGCFMFKKKHSLRKGTYRKTISLLCPTRGRPKKVERFFSSIYRTAYMPERVEILFYMDSDDSCKDEYKNFFNKAKKRFVRLKRCRVLTGEPTSILKAWAIMAKECEGDLMIVANDDQVYVDYGWDDRLDEEVRKFPDDIFCMWFNDSNVGGEHSCFPIVSRRWVQTLGYYSPGIFKFLHIDTWIWDIARKINRLHYIPDVLVEHLAWEHKKAALDNTTQRHRAGAHSKDGLKDGLLLEKTDPQRVDDAKKLKAVIDSYQKAKSS